VADSEGNSFKIRLESRILDLARRQHGHVARFQLLELGASQGLIAGRLAAGAWVAVHLGVYCIGPRRNDPVSRAAAAVLACDPGAVLSHAWAASLWGLLPRWEFPLHVTAERRRERPGIVTHRLQSLNRSDNSLQHGVKVTSRARTILDVAPQLTVKQRTRLVNDALGNHDLRHDALQDVLARNRYHPGTKLLTPFLDLPGRNVYFPDHSLIVELDGWDFHKDRHAFETDRDRDSSPTASALSGSPRSASTPTPTMKPRGYRRS
jgi:hypothetical protein